MVKLWSAHQKSKSGFITIWFLIFLPLAISLCLFLLLTYSHTESESRIRRLCYERFFKAQKKVSEGLDKVLALNKKSTDLKLRYVRAQKNLKMALASENPLWITEATQELNYVSNLRMVLDVQQKTLIAVAQIDLDLARQELLEQVNRELESRTQKQAKYIVSKFEFESQKRAMPGVLAESEELAPNYKLSPDIETKQSLTLNWQKKSFAGPPLAYFIRGRYRELKTCSVAAKKKDQIWRFSVGMDKFW